MNVQRGDIIRLTKLRDKLLPPNGVATVDKPAYLRVTNVGVERIRADMISAPGTRTIHGTFGRQWSVANNDEVRSAWGDGYYEVVPEDQVPDYIWAEIAQHMMLEGPLLEEDEE